MKPKEGSALGQGEDAHGVTSGAASTLALYVLLRAMGGRKRSCTHHAISSPGTGVTRQGTEAQQGGQVSQQLL